MYIYKCILCPNRTPENFIFFVINNMTHVFEYGKDDLIITGDMVVF